MQLLLDLASWPILCTNCQVVPVFGREQPDSYFALWPRPRHWRHNNTNSNHDNVVLARLARIELDWSPRNFQASWPFGLRVASAILCARNACRSWQDSTVSVHERFAICLPLRLCVRAKLPLRRRPSSAQFSLLPPSLCVFELRSVLLVVGSCVCACGYR